MDSKVRPVNLTLPLRLAAMLTEQPCRSRLATVGGARWLALQQPSDAAYATSNDATDLRTGRLTTGQGPVRDGGLNAR